MTRYLACTLVAALLLVRGTAADCAFDERLWEKYASIEAPPVGSGNTLRTLYLDPHRLGSTSAGTPFADLRVVTERKEEVPWQIVSKKPEKGTEEVPARMRNLSRTQNGDSWVEVVLDPGQSRVNAVEVVTPNRDFSRQVEVQGGPDGNTWNTLRADGVIFASERGEKLRHTRITFPETSYRYLALRVVNGNAAPLAIEGVRPQRERETRGETYTVEGTPGKEEVLPTRGESSVIVRMASVFPLDRLVVVTGEENFQRWVQVQVKRGEVWHTWASGTIFSFNSPTMHESQLAIEMPEVAAPEFRLVFNNFDSPPLTLTGVRGEGYRRMLVFPQRPDRKYFLFWGNPQARQPQYDLAGLLARQKGEELPTAALGDVRPNKEFAGEKARLPFSERYKYLLYLVVSLVIAGLLFLQYRVVRRVES